MPEDFIHADFELGSLDICDLDRCPIRQFGRWYTEVQTAGVTEYPAMTLATCGPEGRPSARIVYVRGFDERGFTFYTNYNSRKGTDLAHNPHGALCFYWKELERQVRIEGPVAKVSADESDEYFRGRPMKSQLGAWASEQSQPVDSQSFLEARVEELRQQFASGPVVRPPHWGGYRLVPDRMEFWQGRPSRLHDRFLYELQVDGTWTINRLSP